MYFQGSLQKTNSQVVAVAGNLWLEFVSPEFPTLIPSRFGNNSQPWSHQGLEIITYTITNKDQSCKPPEVYRCPAYIAPEKALQGIMRDCTASWVELLKNPENKLGDYVQTDFFLYHDVFFVWWKMVVFFWKLQVI